MLQKKKLFYWIILILVIGFLGNSVYASEQREPPKVKKTSALHGQFYLEDVVKIYVPSTYNVNHLIGMSKFIESTKNLDK